MNSQRVVILGASNKPDRYSNKAMKALLAAGHQVVLVNRGLQEIDGLPVHPSVSEVTGEVEAIRKQIDEACHKFLSNPVIEDYKFQIE